MVGKNFRIICWVLSLGLGIVVLGCKGPKGILGEEKVELEGQVARWVKCLNEQSESCLEILYADDFESLAPLFQMEDKNAFVQQLVKNYRTNQYNLKVDLMEARAGEQLGYVTMNWQLFDPSSTDKPLYQNLAMSIWKRGAKGQWQLTRLLFYRTDIQ